VSTEDKSDKMSAQLEDNSLKSLTHTNQGLKIISTNGNKSEKT
jgi:hypothetical protein